MLQSRDFPAWLVGSLIAVGCATAENGDTPEGGSGGPKSGSGGLGSGGGAGKASGLGGSSTPTAGSSSGKAGASATGGSAMGGNASGGTGTGGSAEGGSPDEPGGMSQGGSASGGTAGASGGGSGGTSAGGGQGGKAGSGGGGAGGSSAGTAGSTSGGGGSGGGGTTLDCDNPLYVLCDDFEDGNASGWSTSGGTWTVVQSGSYVYRGASGGYQAFAGDAAMTDQIVEAKLANVDFGGSGSSYRAGVIARRSSTSNFYTVVLDAAGDLRLLKGSSSPSGSSGTCDAVSVSPGASFTLRLEVTGATGSVNLKTFLDGNQVHDCTTTSGTLASGSAGVYTYGSNSVADFDDFKVSIP